MKDPVASFLGSLEGNFLIQLLQQLAAGVMDMIRRLFAPRVVIVSEPAPPMPPVRVSDVRRIRPTSDADIAKAARTYLRLRLGIPDSFGGDVASLTAADRAYLDSLDPDQAAEAAAMPVSTLRKRVRGWRRMGRQATAAVFDPVPEPTPEAGEGRRCGMK